jgi:putative DNA primase/helicase
VLDSYTEITPSGTGLHTLAYGRLPPGGRRRGQIEMYDALRFFTVTGHHLAGTPRTLEERTAALAALHAQVFPPAPPAIPHHGAGARRVACDDRHLLDQAHAARNGHKFAALYAGDTSGYPSPSEADLAPCNLLAFWTGGDAVRVDRLFRSSGLYRSKWNEPRGGTTYGARTIASALRGRDG